jgi:hypothetical protein
MTEPDPADARTGEYDLSQIHFDHETGLVGIPDDRDLNTLLSQPGVGRVAFDMPVEERAELLAEVMARMTPDEFAAWAQRATGDQRPHTAEVTAENEAGNSNLQDDIWQQFLHEAARIEREVHRTAEHVSELTEVEEPLEIQHVTDDARTIGYKTRPEPARDEPDGGHDLDQEGPTPEL